MIRYLGLLPRFDPLHHYLSHDILPQLGADGAQAEFKVFAMAASHRVYLYEERHSGVRVLGKFYGAPGQPGTPDTNRRMDREYQNLTLMREYGLTGYPHEVVRPLGRNAWLSSLLVVAYGGAHALSLFLDVGIYLGQEELLLDKLGALAYFFAAWHNRTAGEPPVDFDQDCRYFARLVGQLADMGVVGGDEVGELTWLCGRWREQPRMWEDRQVIVHGDATPANFLFGDGLHVTAIDLERMKRADRVFDVGRIAGEIQHAFLERTGNKYAAEPFIGHFLREYASHFPDRERALASIGGRIPFQMALTLLRIARNTWIRPAHRRRLVEEAKITLRTV